MGIYKNYFAEEATLDSQSGVRESMGPQEGTVAVRGGDRFPGK